MCQARTTDKLLKQLLDEHDLCLLSNALTPEEFKPGMVVTVSKVRSGQRPVRRPFDAVFTSDYEGAITEARYKPILLAQSSGTLTAEIVAKAAGALGPVDPGAFRAALEASGARTFDIGLGDARRATIDDHEVGKHLRTVSLTDHGRELLEDGNDFFLIRSVITAAEVFISGGETHATALEAELKALLEGKSSLSMSSAAQISMSPLDAEMVIGFSASEIIEHPNGGYTLNGLTAPLRKLDDGPALAEPAPAAIFSNDGQEPIGAIALA